MATFQPASQKDSYLKTETSLRPETRVPTESTVVGATTKLTGKFGRHGGQML